MPNKRRIKEEYVIPVISCVRSFLQQGIGKSDHKCDLRNIAHRRRCNPNLF